MSQRLFGAPDVFPPNNVRYPWKMRHFWSEQHYLHSPVGGLLHVPLELISEKMQARLDGCLAIWKDESVKQYYAHRKWPEIVFWQFSDAGSGRHGLFGPRRGARFMGDGIRIHSSLNGTLMGLFSIKTKTTQAGLVDYAWIPQFCHHFGRRAFRSHAGNSSRHQLLPSVRSPWPACFPLRRSGLTIEFESGLSVVEGRGRAMLPAW